MSRTPRIPVNNCLVRYKSGTHSSKRWAVQGNFTSTRVNVRSGDQRESVELEQLTCGFQPGDRVQHQSRSPLNRGLGEGIVRARRELAGQTQLLVELQETFQSVWLPWEDLRWVMPPTQRFVRGEVPPDEASQAWGMAERFRLRNLSYALQFWNENTGALSSFDFDPLPHQIHLVHHILASGNYNWMIADDVGLGKTIEVGMLLWALRQRGELHRILIACPPGLTRQWQEELAEKFDMKDFRIYGHDFEIHEPHQWELNPFVIASLDRLKHENHLPLLKQSSHWDMVIFDEAHKLSRRQNNRKVDYTDRYRLAHVLRQKTPSMLLLTATPHQGREDHFTGLLHLLRPEFKQQFNDLRQHTHLLRECIYRNRKSQVTGQDGQLLFQGQTTRALKVEVGEEEAAFDDLLQDYIRLGYAASERARSRHGNKALAIGFVMTTFRKLAASSHAAILEALKRRRTRLLGDEKPDSNQHSDLLKLGLEIGKEVLPFVLDVVAPDIRFLGELVASQAFSQMDSFQTEFFEDELGMLEELIYKAEELVHHDKKLEMLLELISKSIRKDFPNEKLLIFTEYRGTQQHIANALRERFGKDSVGLIHGSLSQDEKRAQIQSFTGHGLEEGGSQVQFLLSTEAGGEGFNLHHQCHLMVNYDLPWNPMRLVQRIGRLYRYGQEKRVVVFNLHSPQTLDAEIVDGIYERLDRVVQDMAQVSEDFHETMHQEIFGQMASMLDVESLISDAKQSLRTLDEEALNDALEQASQARERQEELFSNVQGFDPDEFRGSLVLDHEHLRSFVLSMLTGLGVEMIETRHRGEVVRVRLTEELLEELGERASFRWICFERKWKRDGVEVMNFQNRLFQLLLHKAQESSFQGKHAVIGMPEGVICSSAVLRWQDEQGQKAREELVVVVKDEEGTSHINPDSFSQWLKEEDNTTQVFHSEKRERKQRVESLEQDFESYLSNHSNSHLLPGQVRLLGFAEPSGTP